MGKFNDLTGKRFGRLIVVEAADPTYKNNGKPRRRWLCECDCGNSKIILGENLTRGLTHSCGCLQKEKTREASMTHGKTDTRLYGVWCAIKRRCYTKSVPEYRLYGGRGITMCDEWRNDFSEFEKWALDAGYREDAPRGECTIDRIDNDKGYYPDNCRWVSQEQQMNNVSYNHIIEIDGEKRTLSQWAKYYNIPYYIAIGRINRYGMNTVDAFTKPIKKRKQK